MDVLKREIDEVYTSHLIDVARLDYTVRDKQYAFVRSLVLISGGCAVISDVSDRTSRIAVSPDANFLGLKSEEMKKQSIDSMDEDYIYCRIHPEDLVEKRLLEYKFFQKTFALPASERLKYRGRCRLRMLNAQGEYQYVVNLVQIMQNTPDGKVWLILCLYELSANQHSALDISPTITHMERGEIETFSLKQETNSILSEREKEILELIRKGMRSKEIASELHISINTVNRHRQNILSKLSVSNSIEACRAAEIMKLF